MNIAITANNPTVSGSGITYSISPALPTGLSINTGSGVISGTPTVQQSSVGYTVTASNTGGNTTAAVSIAVTALPTTPAIPAILLVVQGVPPYVQISNPDPTLTIRLYYSLSPGVSKTNSFVIGYPDPNGPDWYTFDDLHLGFGRKYYLRLSSYNGQAESELTAEYNKYFQYEGWTPSLQGCI